ncbi:EamA family transporter [Paenibacillus sp. OAS669]|uniref:EamA family transporter n=1 Tax=Paenibacillus sp. OAS669 TaxID=2663821 RepID=UPI0017893D97|nr:DMT family transporter [Paenibacillus sp. OAS669]MBE1442258.1 drug/metabolite transporter (DMT)-like permease [Paenibacillus sp. OAS669]
MRGYIYVILGAISYGLLSTFVKLAYKDGFIVNDVVGVQLLMGAILLWGAVLLSKRMKSAKQQKFVKLVKREVLLLTTVGSTTGLTGMFYYLSLQYISASLAIVLLFQFTWIGVLLEAIINRRIPEKGKLLSIIPLLIGTISATNIYSMGLSAVHWLGFLFGLLAALSYSIFILLSGKVAVQANPMMKTALMSTGGFIVCSLILTPTFFRDGKLLLELVMQYGIILAFFGPFLSTLLFSKGVPLVGPGLASILGAMELPTAMLMSVFFLNEHIGIPQYVGIVLILIGISLPKLLKNKQKELSV